METVGKRKVGWAVGLLEGEWDARYSGEQKYSHLPFTGEPSEWRTGTTRLAICGTFALAIISLAIRGRVVGWPRVANKAWRPELEACICVFKDS